MAEFAPAPKSWVIGPVHWRGLATLIRRELARFFKEWIENVIAPTVATLVYLAVFVFALGPDRDSDEGRAVLQFALPGLVMLVIITRAAEAAVFSIVYDKLEGMISDILMPPLSASEITVGYVVAGTVSALVVGAPALVAALLLVDLPFDAPILSLGFAVAAAVLFSLVGVLVGLWSERWDHAAGASTFVFTPLVFLSGTFVPIAAMGEPLATILRFNPAYYVIDGFRAGFSGHAEAPLWLGASVAVVTIGVLWLLCDRLIARGYRIKA